ncbi:hypothetical protein TNCV_1837351 [Trichonephila clavipes]|nr:hypothetical protein TNCV_1837351 [Trichonephila clavipes]
MWFATREAIANAVRQQVTRFTHGVANDEAGGILEEILRSLNATCESNKLSSIPGGRGSLVAKVTDLWQTCHDFEHSVVEDPYCRGAMDVKSVESLNVLPLMRCSS